MAPTGISSDQPRWPPSVSLIGMVIVTDNFLFATTATDTFAVDQKTHTAIWSFGVSGTLAFSDRSLYVAGSDGVVYAFGR